jgi:signal peptidase I
MGLVSPMAGEMLASHVVAGDLVVPPGFISAMGDNRDNFEDSRYWGFVPRENIIGTPFLIYGSFDAATDMGPEHFVDIATHFFTKTRWDRTLKLVRAYPL